MTWLAAVTARRAFCAAGWSIVEYEGRERHVHLLNAEHHVSVLGDGMYAWKHG